MDIEAARYTKRDLPYCVLAGLALATLVALSVLGGRGAFASDWARASLGHTGSIILFTSGVVGAVCIVFSSTIRFPSQKEVLRRVIQKGTFRDLQHFLRRPDLTRETRTLVLQEAIPVCSPQIIARLLQTPGVGTICLPNGQTPVEFAQACKRPEVVEAIRSSSPGVEGDALGRHDLSPEEVDRRVQKNGWNAQHRAVLLNQPVPHLDEIFVGEVTPLQLALQFRRMERVQELYRDGAHDELAALCRNLPSDLFQEVMGFLELDVAGRAEDLLKALVKHRHFAQLEVYLQRYPQFAAAIWELAADYSVLEREDLKLILPTASS